MFWRRVLNRSERVKQKSRTSNSYSCLFLSNLCTGVQERKREKRRKKRKVQGLWSCRCLLVEPCSCPPAKNARALFSLKEEEMLGGTETLTKVCGETAGHRDGAQSRWN